LKHSHGSLPPGNIFSPLVLVAVWTLSGLFLNCAPVSLAAKGWVGLVGILAPFLTAWLAVAPSRPSSPFEKAEWLPPSSLWLPVLLFIAAIFFRFWNLTAYFPWPLGDEALHLSYAQELSRQWSWRLFYGFGQHPPFLIWILDFAYGAFRSPALALRLTSALVSLVSVVVAYAAARKFLSRSSALALGAFCAVSFWPVYAGRFAHQGSLLPLLTGCLFYAWGCWRQAINPVRRRAWAVAWGFLLAAGLYAFPSWISMVLAVGSVWLVGAMTQERLKRDLPWLVGSFLAAGLPLFLQMVSEKFGGHIGRLVAFQGDATFFEQLLNSLSYLSVLLWGSLSHGFAYGPVWGGFLNPLQGALFLLGALGVLRGLKQPVNRWLAAFFFLGLAPGILSVNLEFYRIILLLPLVLVVSVFGARILVETASFRHRAVFSAGLLLLCSGLDFYHLAGPARQALAPERLYASRPKVLEEYQAYPILKNLATSQGPGIILAEAQPDSMNRTLSVCVYPFNAAANRDIPASRASWAAFLADESYRPFLEGRFPGVRIHELQPSSHESSLPGRSRTLLWVFPLSHPADTAALLDAYALFQDNDSRVLNLPNGRSWREGLRGLLEGYVRLPDDPLWQSFYFERLLFTASWEKAFYPDDPLLKSQELADTLETSLRRSYPAAHLLFKWEIWNRPQ
jgi:hypothetical protein